jgi:hypothetical protein
VLRLASRNYASEDAFVRDFLHTLTPGVIPRECFINWDKIGAKGAPEEKSIAFFESLRARFLAGGELQELLTDGLIASRQADKDVRFAFDLLGHTGDSFICREDYLDIADAGRRISGGDSGIARYVAEVLCGVGLDHLMRLGSVRECMVGVRVGLETHRRKNLGGSEFTKVVAAELAGIGAGLGRVSGRRVSLVHEEGITYGNRLNKRVDHCIRVDGKPRFGFEVNFYTSSGSKPTEIKRSYGEVGRGLDSVGVALIWITDGAGYHKMARSLRDAYTIFPNIYNLRQMKDQLALDLGLAVCDQD